MERPNDKKDDARPDDLPGTDAEVEGGHPVVAEGEDDEAGGDEITGVESAGEEDAADEEGHDGEEAGG